MDKMKPMFEKLFYVVVIIAGSVYILRNVVDMFR